MPAEDFVQTVLGPVPPTELGFTLIHEHLLCNLTTPAERNSSEPEVEITLENVFDVTYRPEEYRGNHRLQNYAVAEREVELFRLAGGDTIVDVTTGGMCPDPAGLMRISQESGVNIVTGAGFYTEPYLNEHTLAMTMEALTETMVAQVQDGAWGTSVRCGIIGEIGCSWPLTPFETRSLQAAARAQTITGAAITVHPGRHPDAPHEILTLLEFAGADISRVIIDHMDRTYFDDEEIINLARRGCIVEFDFFGIETSHYWMGVADLPTDWMRIRSIQRLVDAGLGKQVVISQDICTRSRLRSLGGHGYGHLISNVVPLMRDRGLNHTEIEMLLVDTPRRLLTIGR